MGVDSTDPEPEVPLRLHQESVHPDWVDYNGHMNVAYYLLAFDHATDALFDYLDLGRRYLQRENCSFFTVEAHLTYEREVNEGDPLRFETLILGADQKRIHYFHTMHHARQGYLAATNELLVLHVDMTRRRVAPMRPGAQRQLRRVVAAHSSQPVPSQVGHVMSL